MQGLDLTHNLGGNLKITLTPMGAMNTRDMLSVAREMIDAAIRQLDEPRGLFQLFTIEER